jgi:hypothetical protein
VGLQGYCGSSRREEEDQGASIPSTQGEQM